MFYALILHVCMAQAQVTRGAHPTVTYNTRCAETQTQTMYATQAACEKAGKAELATYDNPTGDTRLVDKYRCEARQLAQ